MTGQPSGWGMGRFYSGGSPLAPTGAGAGQHIGTPDTHGPTK